MIAAAPIAIAAPVADATTPTCVAGSSGLVVNDWQGPSSAGDVAHWDVAANWSLGVPGIGATAEKLCIHTDGIIRMAAQTGIQVNAGAVDLSGTGSLDILEGNKLYADGDQALATSVVHAGASVLVSGATLGGTGAWSMAGTLTWRSLPTGAATITSRDCSEFDDPNVCGGPILSGTDTGTMNVTPTGTATVDGRGVNLFDQYGLVVQGTLRLVGAEAYVAADHGTGLTLVGGGRFELNNDGGWYEGRDPYSLPLSTIVNDGRIAKLASPGVSDVSAAMSGSGSVAVAAGTIALPVSAHAEVAVFAGRQLSLGGCGSGIASYSYGCAPTASSAEPQISSFRVPRHDANGAHVTLRQPQHVARSIGKVVQVDASGLATSRTSPATLSLRYDKTLRGGRTAGMVTILRKTAAGFQPIPTCTAAGDVPTGTVGCVDRRANVGSRVIAGGDLLMIVQTVAPSSRWIAR